MLGLLLESLGEDIACQMISKTTAASVWAAMHSMFGAQNKANVRHLRRQIQALRKEDMPAAEYMNKVKALADAMAAAGSPLGDDEIIDHMLTGLGPDFNPLAASMIRDNSDVSLSEFYSHVLSYEALRAHQAQSNDWVSSVNAASRPGLYINNGPPRPAAHEIGRAHV